jgi:hypothetical protein
MLSPEFGYGDCLELRVNENTFALWEQVSQEPRAISKTDPVARAKAQESEL